MVPTASIPSVVVALVSEPSAVVSSAAVESLNVSVDDGDDSSTLHELDVSQQLIMKTSVRHVVTLESQARPTQPFIFSGSINE